MTDTTTTAIDQTLDKFNFGNLPEPGNRWAGEYFNKLWEEARAYKIDRLGLHERWIELHKLVRGQKKKRNYPSVGANYIFKTIESICAILTEKHPKSEIESDEAPEDQVKAFNEEKDDWWNELELQDKLYASVMNMEEYGTTIEKGVWNSAKETAEIDIRDPFNFFPAPGYVMCDMDLPNCCDVYFLEPWEIRQRYGLDDSVIIPTDAEDQLIGKDRETVRGGSPDKSTGSQHYPSNYVDVPGSSSSSDVAGKTLVVEMWIRDNSTYEEPIYETQQAAGIDPNTGDSIVEEFQVEVDRKQRPNYKDGIRNVVLCPALLSTPNIYGILNDMPNPNINWGLFEARVAFLIKNGILQPQVDQMGQPMINPATGQPAMQAVPVTPEDALEIVTSQFEKMFLWGRFPYSATPSHIDTSQWWGFSIIEQLEEMQGKAEGLLTKYIAYFNRAMFPILILPKGCGVQKSEINNDVGLIIQPRLTHASQIRYVQAPNVPAGYLDVLQFVLMQMDVIGMSPEVTEGRKPKGVSAASAIVALQDKASTLIQPQIRQIDKLIRNRGRMFVSFMQNFGTKRKPVKIDEERLVDMVGIEMDAAFRFLVESGSSAPITKAGRRQQYIELYNAPRQAMDLESLLENLEIPNADIVVERLTEQNSLPGALDILIQAGLPQEDAIKIYQFLMKSQGGTGRPKDQSKPPRAGGYSEGMTQANEMGGGGELRV